jgi:hypothetical protein
MADKGDTYYCTWEREADGSYRGWEIRRPELSATAPAPRQLSSALGRTVGRYYDDHEAALHFDPPLRESGDPRWFTDGLMAVA